MTKREIGLVWLFWTFMGLLTAANRLFDFGGLSARATPWWIVVLLAFAESYVWALATPLVFSAARYFRHERFDRTRQVAALAVIGLVVAAAVANATAAVRLLTLSTSTRLPDGLIRPYVIGIAPTVVVLNAFVVYLGVLAAGFARDFSLRYRARQQEAERLRTQLSEARLESLRRQLDPHFLFNTLHAVSSLVERDPRGARQMVARLSALLRHSIEERGPDQEIELAKEMELLEQYLDIMRIRFQGRLTVESRVDPAVRSALLPNLALQPIVENAIRHGTSRIEGPGRIELEASREGGTLVFRVRDNGPGISPHPARQGDSSGVGIRNLQARLAQLYGRAARFTLRAGDGAGSVAELRVPYHTRDRLGGPAERVA